MKIVSTLVIALCLGSLTALWASVPSAGADDRLHRIPVRIHLISDMAMAKKGVAMTNWLTAGMIENTVLPEVNRIWSGAKIEWTLNGVTTATTKNEGREEAITHLLQATRDGEGHADPERVKKLEAVFQSAEADRRAVNLYVIPYLGGTSQGVASSGKRRVILGQWTDKPSRGSRPPERCLLVEPGSFERGSFSRTLGHELGHVLGLAHPAKGAGPFHRLMGGSKPGNELTESEIATARKHAAELSARFRQP